MRTGVPSLVHKYQLVDIWMCWSETNLTYPFIIPAI